MFWEEEIKVKGRVFIEERFGEGEELIHGTSKADQIPYYLSCRYAFVVVDIVVDMLRD